MMNRIKVQIWIVSLLAVLLSSHANACLTFCLRHADTLVYGRNFDWNVDVGAVVVNQRHVRKSAFVVPPENPVSWVSVYGSVTFNQFSKDVPVGGMNEKGLVIECLVSAAAYPRADKRSAINELQWIQYHLDTCSTVGEVIASAQKVRIAPYAVKLHYFLTDASGNSAVLEFAEGKLLYRTGKRLPEGVLANTSYDRAHETMKSSSSRFARCARAVRQYDGRKDAVAYAFGILDAVAQGDFTKWQVVYDIPRRRIAFRTLQNRRVKQIALSEFDFEHETEPLLLDVNTDEGGPVRNRFRNYTETLNDELMTAALKAYRTAGIMQHIKAEHIEFIRAAVAAATREAPVNADKAVDRTP